MTLVERRPWGEYCVLASGKNWQVKRLTINPKQRFSLQKHYYRSEHWVIVEGLGHAQVYNHDIALRRGDHLYVPVRARHRLRNSSSKYPLVVVETQIGKIDENDVVRLEDDYDRC